MKKYVPFNLMALMVGLAILTIGVACEEEEGIDPYEPYYLVIDGPTEVAPGDTVTYAATSYENESYSWTVPDNATIVDSNEADTIQVAFPSGSGGNVTVSVKGLTESETIAVNPANPTSSITLADTSLSQGGTSTVFINYNQDITTAPTLQLRSNENTDGGTLDNIERVDERTFRATYTAGTGDGTDEIVVTGGVSTPFYGSVTDTLESVFNLNSTDNTPATGELFASRTPATPDNAVLITATFSESLYTTQDSVRLSITSTSALNDTTYLDSVVMSTLDGATWTYEFEPGEGINDIAEVSVDAPTDPAGNTTEAIEPIILEIKDEE